MTLIKYKVRNTDLVEKHELDDAFTESVYIARGVDDELNEKDIRIAELEAICDARGKLIQQYRGVKVAYDSLFERALKMERELAHG